MRRPKNRGPFRYLLGLCQPGQILWRFRGRCEYDAGQRLRLDFGLPGRADHGAAWDYDTEMGSLARVLQLDEWLRAQDVWDHFVVGVRDSRMGMRSAVVPVGGSHRAKDDARFLHPKHSSVRDSSIDKRFVHDGVSATRKTRTRESVGRVHDRDFCDSGDLLWLLPIPIFSSTQTPRHSNRSVTIFCVLADVDFQKQSLCGMLVLRRRARLRDDPNVRKCIEGRRQFHLMNSTSFVHGRLCPSSFVRLAPLMWFPVLPRAQPDSPMISSWYGRVLIALGARIPAGLSMLVQSTHIDGISDPPAGFRRPGLSSSGTSQSSQIVLANFKTWTKIRLNWRGRPTVELAQSVEEYRIPRYDRKQIEN